MARTITGAAIYDLALPSDYMVALMIEEDLLTPLDYDALPNFSNLDDAWDNPPFDPEHRHHVACQWGTTGIGMTYDVLDALGGESSWAVIFDADTVCSAHAMISFLRDAENGAALTNYTYYGSPNEAATPYILDQILEDPGIYPPPEVYELLELIPQMGDLGRIVHDMLTEANS